MTSGLFTRVTFKVSVETVFGDSVFVTGNAPILGNDTPPVLATLFVCVCHARCTRQQRMLSGSWIQRTAAEPDLWVYLGCEFLSPFLRVQVLTQYVGIVCMFLVRLLEN